MRPNPRRQLQGEKEEARKNKYTSYAYVLLKSIVHSPFCFLKDVFKHVTYLMLRELITLHPKRAACMRKILMGIKKVVLSPFFTKMKKKMY